MDDKCQLFHNINTLYNNNYINPNNYSNNFYYNTQMPNNIYFHESANNDNNAKNYNYSENKYSYQSKNKRDQKNMDKKPCGIINYGKNCYLNSGLQILSACDKFVEELHNFESYDIKLIILLNDAMNKILTEDFYDPSNFLQNFCLKNKEFYESQSCSQTFIRTLLKNVNNELINLSKNLIVENNQYTPNKYEEANYYKFISNNNIFPESKALSIFSGMNKSHSNGNCQKCGNKIEDISFSYFVDLNIYLDKINKKCNFSDVLDENFGKNSILTMNCPKCDKEIKINEETKIIKLPDILIFTLERYQDQTNNVEIIPEDIIDMKNYIDNDVKNINTKYELFAINIRFGHNRNFGHEICQIKRNGKWYEINDTNSYEKTISHNSNSYGLFYKRKKDNFI